MMNSFGHIFRFTTWGESHGPALGATVDGVPPGVEIDAAFIQQFLDRRRPGQSKMTTQRQEPDAVRILSGVFEGRTTGTPIQLMIENTDQRSRDYGEIAQAFRPGHADIAYHWKYGIRDYRGGGRSSARETAARVAAGGVAQAVHHKNAAAATPRATRMAMIAGQWLLAARCGTGSLWDMRASFRGVTRPQPPAPRPGSAHRGAAAAKNRPHGADLPSLTGR